MVGSRPHASINDVTALDAVVAVSSYRVDMITDDLLEYLANSLKLN